MNKPTREQVVRILCSSRDIDIANSSLVFLFEGLDFEGLEFDKKYDYTDLRRFRAFEANAIISYCRPFAQSKQGTTINFGYANIKFDVPAKILHDKIMMLRSKVIAHSDSELMHFNLVLYDMNLEGADGEKINLPFPHLIVDEGLHLEEFELLQFHEHVRGLQHTLTRAIMDMSKEYPDVMQGYVKPQLL